MKTLELFFGRSIGENGYVDDIMWSTFCDSIDKHFDGYTISDSIGCWKGQQEKSKVVSILCKSLEDEQRVKTLCLLYCSMFNQQSVAIQELPALQFIYHE